MELLTFSDFLKEGIVLAGDLVKGNYMRLVAAAYKIAPRKDESTIPAYRELVKKISRQNEFLQSKYDFKPDPNDHYKDANDLMHSVKSQWEDGKRRAMMYVYSAPPGDNNGDTGHPVLSNDENVMIRGVHDAMAHIGGNHQFSARGEFGAYLTHLKTLCGNSSNCQAGAILFSEIVAQTAYYYVYGNFPPQKAVFFPDFDYQNIGRLNPSSPLNRYFVEENKHLVFRPGADLDRFFSTPIGAEFNRQSV